MNERFVGGIRLFRFCKYAPTRRRRFSEYGESISLLCLRFRSPRSIIGSVVVFRARIDVIVMMTKRPWPPLYRHPVPVAAGEAMLRRDGKIYAVEPRFGIRSKCPRDCYFVAAPMYRPSAQFAPVPFLPPGLVKHMMVFEPPPRDRVHFKQPLVDRCPCSCLKVRSRSLENLCPSDVTSSTNDEREVIRRRRKIGKENFKRRSMDNLLECGKPTRRKVWCFVCVFAFKLASVFSKSDYEDVVDENIVYLVQLKFKK